ncbi:MAG: hypothetical protein JXP34_11605 [Planctomycetes bacterium]|nr:hypothetical protein [Planctomycetota bacterium]
MKTHRLLGKGLLGREVERVARRVRALRAWTALAVAAFAAAILGGIALALVSRVGPPAAWAGAVAVAVAIVAGGVAACLAARSARDPRAIARRIEARHPDLDSRLVTAVEQEPALPGGEYGFLQEAVVREAIAHGRGHAWDDLVPAGRLRAARGAHLAGLLLLIGVVLGLAPHLARRAGSGGDSIADPASVARRAYEVEVAPGDAEIERGTSLVVTARFAGEVPDEAVLVVEAEGEEAMGIPMDRSLSDLVFGARIPDVRRDLTYRVQYAGERSPAYRVTVFDLPALVRADARLRFPAYTGLEEKLVEDTRRVTAVEGTEATLFCQLNKAVETARLVPDGGEGDAIPLAATPDEPARYAVTRILTESARFRLELIDAVGRRNRDAPAIIFRVTPNVRPDVKIAVPGRDTRVSPIEELATRASVWDDFGLVRYGIRYGFAGESPEEVVLGDPAAGNERREVGHLIDFEALEAKPDQLVSYFFWAEDVGPDGNPRRTSGDMYFAEVRHFEEIFREAPQPPRGAEQERSQREGEGEGEGEQQGEGNAAERAEQLAERQKEIINATWKVIRRDLEAAEPAEAAETTLDDRKEILTAQTDALEQATSLAERLEDPESMGHVEDVVRSMREAIVHLNEAAGAPPVDPLHPALGAEQAAYQALLKLRAREFRVRRAERGEQDAQQQRGAGSASGPQSRSQRQLDQLALRNVENRYETERMAREHREQETRSGETRQVLNRLRDLARRQRDVNERLKELQSALETAKTEEERAAIERELKRLREEQRELLRDADALADEMGNPQNRERMAEAQRHLEETREAIRQTTEALREGQVSRAVASGTRAERTLRSMEEEFRGDAADRFSEDVRELRDAARALEEKERELTKRLEAAERGATKGEAKGEAKPRSLRDPGEREQLGRDFGAQREGLDRLLENVRQTVEEAEEAEPLMTRKLYDALREARQERVDDALDVTRALVERGLLPQARATESAASQGIEDLRQGIEEAAESVLGDGTEALRRARDTLSDLAREVEEDLERSGSAPRAGEPREDERKAGGRGGEKRGERPEGIERFAEAGAAVPRGPFTGGDFRRWSERLRDVEEMLEDPDLRNDAARIRERVRDVRRETNEPAPREFRGPNWDLVRMDVLGPLTELRDRIGEELLRRGSDDALVPIDRDPVPPKYADQVRRYYEKLGRGK